jgi:RHS repeat-associated protein
VTTAGSDTFDWDAENRLIETDIASTTGTYAYNGDGLRATRTIGPSAVSYVWDLNASLPVILQDTAGNRYIYGLDLLTRIDGTDEEWYLDDGLGSTTGLADDTGAVTGAYEYDVFGAVRTHTGDATEWSYTGEQNDPTELEYLRARYYDAGTGRFLTQDPLPLQQRYAYVGNDPVRYTDPSGECRVELRLKKIGRIGIGWVGRDYYHAYIYTEDKEGAIAFRGGPGRNSGASGSSTASTSKSTGSDSTDTGPRPFGYLITDGEAYNGGHVDFDDEGDDPTAVLRDDTSSCLVTRYFLYHAAQSLTESKIHYDPVFNNSNAAAREMLERALLPTDIKPHGWTPGWSTQLN